MTLVERFLKCYSEGDWIARYILTTCFAAALNFLCVFSEMIERLPPRGDDLFFCYFGPPPAFHPRFFVLLALAIATWGAFHRTLSCRVLSGLNLLGALVVYAHWWVSSRNAFQNAEVNFASYGVLRQSPYLWGGSWLDLGVALSLLVCLALVLDRLFDGEKRSVGWSNYLFEKSRS